MTPADGKLHVIIKPAKYWDAWIELRPDPRTPTIDATAIVAYLGGPEPERYARLFAAAPELLERVKKLARCECALMASGLCPSCQFLSELGLLEPVSPADTPVPSNTTGPGAGGTRGL